MKIKFLQPISLSQIGNIKSMINELSRRYLQELRAAQSNIESSRLKDETQDGTDHEVLETHTSEYNLELGPLKVNVKKSKTVTGKTSSFNKASQSLSKDELNSENSSYTKEQLDGMRNLQPPENDLPQDHKRIDITI